MTGFASVDRPWLSFYHEGAEEYAYSFPKDKTVWDVIEEKLQGDCLLINGANMGTSVTIVLDQIIEKAEDSSSLGETVQKLSNKDKILLIDDKYHGLEVYSKQIKKYGYDVSTSMFESASIVKLERNEKYSILFIDNESEDENAIDYIN